MRTMTKMKRSAKHGRAEMESLRARIAELENTLKAIRSGEVDAIVVDGPRGSRLFTLQSPEEPYRILAEPMNEGAATLNAQGTVLFCNRRFADMLQLPAERIVGASLASLLSPQEQPRFLEWIASAQQISVRGEAHFLRSDGTLLPVQLSLSSIPLEEAEMGLCLVAADLSDQKRAQEQIRKFSEELECRVAMRTEQLRAANVDLAAFNYGVAHDLRAPLRHIQGFSGILANDAGSTLSPDGRHALELIVRETSRMEKLLQALLGLSQVGRQTLHLKNVDLNSLVREVIESFASDVRGRPIEWRIGKLPAWQCDPVLMKLVYTNLLGNALKFTSGTPAAVIEVAAEPRDPETLLSVRDNGVGFNMKYADKLFGVFQRLHRQEDFEGTGVGLATVQRIIQKHGGRIWAEAEPDKGASFYFTLGSAARSEEKTKAMVAGENHA